MTIIAFYLYPAKLIYLNFHPLKVVSRYRYPQLQMGENYLFNPDVLTHIAFPITVTWSTNKTD